MQSKLARLAAIITDLRLFTPNNLEEEKKKFFADAQYNPQFTYNKTDFPMLAFKDDLEKYLQEPQDEDERISNLVQERVRELLLWMQLHETKGTDAFSDIAIKLYSVPSISIVQEAKKYFTDTIVEECPTDRTLSAKDILPRMQAALREEGLEWDVNLRDDILPRMHIIKGKELRINSQAKFSEQDVKKLIVHEIQTHARRYKNGLQQENDIFSIGTAHYLETEEGLATYNEDSKQLLTTRVKKNLAARVLAVHKAKTNSFSEVYEELAPLVGEDKAFEITLSVKKGLSDTSKPGGFTKAHLYFSGWQKVKQLSEEERQLLNIGKISFLHLPLIKELIQEQKVKQP